MVVHRSLAISAATIILKLLIVSLGSPVFAQDYLIGSQDLLKISVFEFPDLTTEARVSEDGKITFPLLGEIDAKNQTTRQLEKGIAEKLAAKKIVKEPQVNVFVEQYWGSRVTIIGEVMKPGQYEITGPTTVLDTISLALGLTQNAGYTVTIFRKEQGGEISKKIVLDIDGLLNGGDLSQNVKLQNGDVVYVPKSVFYIYGEVNRPGAYRLEKGITVKRAIALAGGLTANGSERRIEITRRDQKREVSTTSAIDDPVIIDDVIKVRESIF